ncbi:MAG: acylphosphatase [Chloroflexi bacterium]|nr:acylphosphatase [Chloroflexota bacterium]
MAARLHCVIRGHVQGVGFRAYLQAHALSLGIGGRVKNLPDGSVELVAIGPSASLGKFLEHCRTGPMAADVGSLDEEWSVAEQDEHPFFQIEP